MIIKMLECKVMTHQYCRHIGPQTPIAIWRVEDIYLMFTKVIWQHVVKPNAPKYGVSSLRWDDMRDYIVSIEVLLIISSIKVQVKGVLWVI